MEGGEGMVAVVRGLRDSGLAVTLLDGSKQYTLVPNAAIAPVNQSFTSHDVGSQHSTASEKIMTCDSGAQVTDGRYASTYKMAHCSVRPTSPPIELTEFPPQRAEVYRGADNFEIGGCGSGESHGGCKPNVCRSGVSPDRGPVSPRASREPDAFASSLRQYPQMSIEKSTELVERLISYTQAKNLSTFSRYPPQPVSEIVNRVNADRGNFKSITNKNDNQDEYGTFTTKTRIIKESPTRDIERNCFQENDTNELRKGLFKFTGIAKKETSPVNMEVQAAAEMISKKVDIMQREHATALHESSFANYQNHSGDVLTHFYESGQNINLYDTDGRCSRYCQILNKEYEKPNKEWIQRRKSNKKSKKVIRKLLRNTEEPEVLVNIGNISHAFANESHFAANTEMMRSTNPDRNKDTDIYENQAINSNTVKYLKKVIIEWIMQLPIKTVKMQGTSLHDDDYVGIVEDISSIIDCYLKDDTDENVRKSLLNLFLKIPMNIYDCHKTDYLNQEINSLIRKVKTLFRIQNDCKSYASDHKKIKFCEKETKDTQSKEKQLADFINKELSSLLYTSYPYTADFKKIVGAMLADSVLASIHALRDGKEIDVVNEIVQILQKVSPITCNYLKTFANKLVLHAKKVFKTEHSEYFKGYTVLVNAPSRVNNTNKSSCNGHNYNTFKDSIMPITQEDIDVNIDIYVNQLSRQIDQWLQENHIEIPSSHNRDLRMMFIHDLVRDIVDRHKYLEFNPSSRGSDEVELEHLKYLIYKRINKLLSIENANIIEHAPALMQKIKSISEPMLRLPKKNSVNGTGHTFLSDPKSCESLNCKNNLHEYQNTAQSSNDLNQKNIENLLNASKSQIKNMISSRCSTSQKHSSLSMKQLNEYYDNFVKTWVNEIPIPSATPQERKIANKARQGIYNGIWKAVTKLKFNPEVFHDSFYYEDVLENDIDELFNCLPETPELSDKKHILKVALINQTRNTNNMIRTLLAPSSYRQQLVDVVARRLPLNDVNDKDIENIQMQKVVDDFILCKQFKQYDKSKAEIHGKKLVKEIGALIQNHSHIEEFKDHEPELYVVDFINTLNMVPSPNEDIIKEEANAILLGNDIQHWFLDLPFDDVGFDQSQILKFKNNLVKRIMQLMKDRDGLDCAKEKELKNEIVLLLKKLPLKENINKEFLVQELNNRINNRIDTNNLENNERKKSLTFLNSKGYYEFSADMPGCSSFIDMPMHPVKQNQSSYIVKDGERIKNSSNIILPLGNGNESEEYFTIPGSSVHAKHDQIKTAVPKNQSRGVIANDQIRLPSQTKVPSQSAMSSNHWQTSQIENNGKFSNQFSTKPEHESTTQTQSPDTSNKCMDDILLLNENNTHQTKSIQIGASIAALPTPLSIETQTNPETSSKIPQNKLNTMGQDVFLEDDPRRSCNVNSIKLATPTGYGHAQGFSTPRQSNGHLVMPKLKKKCHEPQRLKISDARRQLSIETDIDDDTEKDERCRCKELMFRMRRRPCFFYDDFDSDDDGCYPYSFTVPY